MQKSRAFAVLFTDGTAGLYKRACALPAVGDTFDGDSVSYVVDGIESKWDIFRNQSSLTSVSVADPDIQPKNTSYWFYKCQKLTSVDLSKINFSADAAMNSMFAGCSSLSALDVTNWDTSRVTSMGYMFNGCSSLRSLTVGTGFTLDLSKTGFPVSTLYTADGTAVALADVPKGVVATYYTKAEYVSQQPAGDEPAADRGSAVQNADAAANAVVGDAPDAGTTDVDGSPASNGSVSYGDPAPGTDSASATQSDAVQDDPTIPLSDTQPEFSHAA